jgi:CRP/FNR family transcriptional regulator, cyclic AMP receptor protein
MDSESVLPLIRSCLSCRFREDRLFCNLDSDALHELERLKRSSAFSEGQVLFHEGQTAEHVMILCQGRVKLSVSSPKGKKMILSIAEAGEVLGLSSVIAEKGYEATAEALEPVQVNTIERKPFIEFLHRFQNVAVHAARELSEAQLRACNEVRLIGLAQSVPQKLAGLLLQWDEKNPESRRGMVKLSLTHEEVGQLLGTSRETVTRALTELKKKKIISIRGVNIHILSAEKLRQAAGL